MNHQKIAARHKRVLRSRKPLKYKQKNIDLLLYLNYLRFMNALIKKANEAAEQDASSGILDRHLQDAQLEFMKRFRG
ncbi:hypothetical protein OGAPHI_000488 [Ogataea philodendri]|uniref:Uncharacterized protein n=1 Tax=Ogataea philodendri TaxID=1378263 RepID=A0A9P8PGN4_9ASCO|nr:uncharacterized protein OGAPHI_000488 [Ogataea philodendri]KAH3671265.1 hypothetical protein OGAPHI_000488 [Ogataea philodendri]